MFYGLWFVFVDMSFTEMPQSKRSSGVNFQASSGQQFVKEVDPCAIARAIT